MKRTIAALLVSSIAVLAFSSPGASAHQAGPKHCRNTYFSPQYLTIKKISAQGTGCTTARGLSLAYMRAVTMSVGAHPHSGHCFGAHSYGHCTVQQKGKKFDCFHFDPVPSKKRGLVRCTAGPTVVKFNIGN
jgi:hypothetical protein